MNREKVGTSHEGKYSYWLNANEQYIYQYDELRKRWCGWLCHITPWEQTFSKAEWITMETDNRITDECSPMCGSPAF